MLLYIVLPKSTAFLTEEKLSSSITMSPASFATSVPLPIAKPTSARLSAARSFTPSPVIPATMPFCCAMRTRRLLSVGKALAITLTDGKIPLTSSSLILCRSSDVSTTSRLLSTIPASFAIATAVSFLSPVIITTCIPARFTSETEPFTSGRKSSRIPTKPIKIRLSGISELENSSAAASAITRSHRCAISSMRALSPCTDSSAATLPPLS